MTEKEAMDWILPALLTALMTASQDALVKRYFSNLSMFDMLAFPMAYSLPLFGLILPHVPVPALDGTFAIYFIAGIPVNLIGFLLHMRAIQVSPLSLSLPYLAFTPVFILLTGFVILGEVANGWGVFGVCIIVAGAYVLNIDPEVYSPLSPFIALCREKGSLLMLLTAFIYSVGAVIGKKAIQHSSVMFFTTAFFSVFNSVCLAGMLITGRTRFGRLKRFPLQGALVGGLLFGHALCHGWAISMTKAVYMIAVKRLSILFGVIYGGLFFHERHLMYRMIGAGLMVVGAAVVTLKGL
jgi:drug/metabolite transporter (DMT)-like permease